MVGDQETKAGNYFVSNYPPYSFWTPSAVPEAMAALDRAPLPDTPLGVYMHIPFCRKRCHFCYFRVYTDKNASEILRYLDSVIAELTTYASKPFIGGRKPRFVYFGGGTPSYLSTTQLIHLTDAMKALLLPRFTNQSSPCPRLQCQNPSSRPCCRVRLRSRRRSCTPS